MKATPSQQRVRRASQPKVIPAVPVGLIVAALIAGPGVIGNLIAPWSNDHAQTEFKAFYTDEYFVFRFNVVDSAIVDIGDTEESVAAGDRVELFFSRSPALAEPYYCIEISPRGRVLDYEAVYYRKFSNAYTLNGLQVSSKQTLSGYEVEGKIALSFFKQLMNTDNMKGTKVYVGAFRAEMSYDRLPDNFVWYTWINPKSTSPDFHIPSSFGIFQF